MSRPGCLCQQIACACTLVAAHHKLCKFRLAVLCPVPIECEPHGFDVCPVCDPCECAKEELKCLKIKRDPKATK